MKVRKTSIFILLAILIFTQIVCKSQIYRKISKHELETHQFRFWQKILDKEGRCVVEADLVMALITDCEGYRLGEKITVFGKLEQLPDKGFFSQKRLNIQYIHREKLKFISGEFMISLGFHFIELLQLRIHAQLERGLSSPFKEVVTDLLFSGYAATDNEAWWLSSDNARTVLRSLKPSSYSSLLLTEMLLPILGSVSSQRIGRGALVIFLLLFDAISGFSVALNRVVIASVLQFLAGWFFRQQDSLSIFFFSFGFLAAFVPFVIFNSSFQFLFLAGLGIRLFMPLWSKRHLLFSLRQKTLQQIYKKTESQVFRYLDRGKDFLLSNVLLFVSAQVFTLPLGVYKNQSISLNDVSLQFVLFLFLGCFILMSLFCCISALVLPTGLLFINLIGTGPLHLLSLISDFWSTLPPLKFTVPFHSRDLLLSWGMVFLFFLFFRHNLYFQAQTGDS